ncbi:hypothetical protein ACQUQP_14955 [Marinobacterium sp. YM272]|uniref:hypothetical protein n=1 Tax=Marinobacterium sp. YM272 TaxID=3421654 RepID=UPI003D7F3799
MLRTLTLIGLSFGLLLAGCTPAAVKPGAPGTASAAEQQAGSEQQPAAPEPEKAAAESPTGSGAGLASLGNQLDQLNGRLTLVQEQLIKLRTQTQQQGELNQMVLTRLQQMAESGAFTAAPDSGGEMSDSAVPASGQIDAAIAQLLQTANELGLSNSSDLYDVASAYTAKGVWVLIRYRRDTGETWLADQGQWQALAEEGVPAASSFAVRLQRADQDLKGYVAVRIDRNTGESWWLNDRRWQRYE